MKKIIANVLEGVVFLALGVGVLGEAVGFWDFKLFDGWWTLLIIVPSILDILIDKVKIWNITTTTLGIVLLLRAQNFFDKVNIWLLLVGALLVAWGTRSIFGGKNPFKKKDKSENIY